MSTAGPELDYAAADPIRGRKRRNRIIVASGLLGLVLAIWRFAAPAWHSIQYQYWLHEANTYALPSTCVVYDEDPGQTKVLLTDPHYQRSTYNPPGWMPYTARLAPPIVNLQKQNPLRMTQTPLFLHSRCTPSGKARLVVLWPTGNPIRPDATGASPDNQVRVELFGSVIDGHNVKETRVDLYLAPMSLADNPPKPLYLRFFAGQADEKDTSHFTVPYEFGDYHDTLDIHLLDNDSLRARPLNLHKHQPDDPWN
jgi:hypothetical protein